MSATSVARSVPVGIVDLRRDEGYGWDELNGARQVPPGAGVRRSGVVRRVPGADVDGAARDVPGVVGGEEHDGLGDVRRWNPRDVRDVVQVVLVDLAVDVGVGRVVELRVVDLAQVLVADDEGVHHAGVDRVDGDAVPAEFLGRGLHQTDHPPFRGCVACEVLHSVSAHPGRRGDDAAVLALDHVRGNGSDGVEDAVEVDVDDGRPVGGGGLRDRSADVGARVGDQNVDLPELVECAGHDGVHRGG